MKRVLVAGVLGSLLLLGAPTLASSAPKSDTKAEKGDGGGKGGSNKSGDGKSGDHKSGGDHKGGDKGRDGKGYGDGKGHDGKRDGHWRGRDGRHRHGHHRGGYYGGGYGYGYGYPGYYGDGYDCYYGRNGAYNCEEYGGDWDPYGYNYRGGYREGYVVVRQNAFSPQQANARPGQTVLWQFADGNVPHTVTADNGSFDSGQKVNDEFQLRFNHPGTYSYHCTLHPEMRGRVVVG